MQIPDALIYVGSIVGTHSSIYTYKRSHDDSSALLQHEMKLMSHPTFLMLQWMLKSRPQNVGNNERIREAAEKERIEIELSGINSNMLVCKHT